MPTKKSKQDRAEELEQVLIDLWNEAQESDGSRGGMQSALDSIQALIEGELPDVADYEASDASDEDEDDASGED